MPHFHSVILLLHLLAYSPILPILSHNKGVEEVEITKEVKKDV